MRQYRGYGTIEYKKPLVLKETSKAIQFKLDDDNIQWIPKKWIKKYSKNRNTMFVKEYWITEMYIKGFEKKSKFN